MEQKICKTCKKSLDIDNFIEIKRIYPPFSSNCLPRHYVGREAHCVNCKKENDKIKAKRHYWRHHAKILSETRKRNKTPARRKCARDYFRNRRHQDPSFRIKDNISRRIRDALKTTRKSRRTVELLGCSPQELKLHLERQFCEGMTWDNYGEWHIDHKLPCASFDLTKPSEQEKCFRYTNLQPLWAKDNLSKSDSV